MTDGGRALLYLVGGGVLLVGGTELAVRAYDATPRPTRTVLVNGTPTRAGVGLSAPLIATVNKPVALHASSIGFQQPTYQFWWESPTGTWFSSGGYGTAASAQFTPTQTGMWHVIVYARDASTPAQRGSDEPSTGPRPKYEVWSHTLSIWVI